MVQLLRAFTALAEDPSIALSSQPPAAQVSGDLMAFSGLCGHQAHA